MLPAAQDHWQVHGDFFKSSQIFQRLLVLILVPVFHVVRMRFEIRARVKVTVVELQIKMMRLQENEDQNCGNCSREFAETVQGVLSLQGNAFFEFLAMDLRRGPYF